MLSNITDMQIVGLVALTTILFIIIRHITKKLKLYPSKRLRAIAKDVKENTVNGNTTIEVARKAITLTIQTSRIIAPQIKQRDSQKYKELLTCTNNLVGSWLKTYPEWIDQDSLAIVNRLKEWNFKIDMFSDSLLHGELDEAEDLIAVLPSFKLRDDLYVLVDSFKK